MQSTPYVFLMEFCAGGCLYDIIMGTSHELFVKTLRSSGSKTIGPRLAVMSWKQRLKIADDVALGMAYLHERNILHRDLKSQNILLAEKLLSIDVEPHAR